ncbi:MAG: GIY-YIG nuclease family protein [Candidatus Atribacteria bacterium]
MFKKVEATYVLLIDVLKDFKTVVGRLGRVSFKKGNYIYIGSAKGYLEARLRRHLKKDKKTFWHIDYLLKNRRTQISKIWVIPKSIECEIAEVFYRNPFTEIVRKGFGSSDCNCLTHLFYIKNKEQTERILEKIGLSRIREFGF